MLTPRNWSLVKSGAALRIRSPGCSEEGRQWEYWNFAGGIDGDLVVEYGYGGTGYTGRLSDATIEEVSYMRARPTWRCCFATSRKASCPS
jgi:hypothetical protein